FGTGYSSLSCLLRYPINALKIDRSFIANFERNRDYAAVVQTIIGLAHNLRASVIGEGIERIEQCAMLQAMDCDSAQGHYFCAPQPASIIEALLAAPSAVAAAA